jgi:glycosyltransferase involved in cell wall biosynthesis
VDKLVAISRSTKLIVEEFSSRQAELIPDIALPQELNKARAKGILAEMGNAKHVIGSVAALTHEKDPLTTVEVIRELAAVRKDFIFLHFGEGDLKEKLEEKIAEYQLQKVYYLMGFIDDIEDMYAVFDVFLMNSVNEGMGSSVLDAFLYKVPVVATRAGGMAELIAEGKGVACDIKSSKQLAEGVDVLLSDEQIKTEIVQRAYEYVLTHHSLQTVTDKYLQVFRQLV